jgi:hypothetical protein
LSYVGEPFEYDVFVSYAHADVETEAPLIRNWSKHVAGRLRDLLGTALNVAVNTGDYKVNMFLDDRELVSGEPLSEILREKVQRSALLIVFMSPLYPKKSWCLDELEGFFEQASKDGRDQRHCTVLRIQWLPDTSWPKRLRDQREKPVLYRDFCDPRTEHELPIGLTNPNAPELEDALLETFIEIKGKLKTLRKQLEARRQIARLGKQRPADRPVIYLYAAPEVEPLWLSKKRELKSIAIVQPGSLPKSYINTDPLGQEQKKERHRIFETTEGLVLLYGQPGAWIEDAVQMIYLDRRLFRQRDRDLPWAILDFVGETPQVVKDYEVPCVLASSPEWQRELLTALGLSMATSGSST